MRASSIVVAERPTLAPPYQPPAGACARTGEAASAANAARPSIPDVCLSFMASFVGRGEAAFRAPAR